MTLQARTKAATPVGINLAHLRVRLMRTTKLSKDLSPEKDPLSTG